MKLYYIIFFYCVRSVCQEHVPQRISPNPVSPHSVAYAHQKAIMNVAHAREQKWREQATKSRMRALQLKSQMNGSHAKL